MARDEREEERAFLGELKARSGRDLAEWLAAIAAQGFADKNQTIDWLRTQGLPFARASWLERIHTNGGKPIYADEPAEMPPAPTPRAAPREKAAPKPVPSASDVAALEKLVAAAGGYRPLYHLLEAELRKAIPDLGVTARSTYISLAGPREFAAITCHASELRLGLALGEHPFDLPLQKAKLKGPGAGITHMVVLTDARQVNGDLLALVQAANARVNR
jgi:hypothetical protein